MSRPTARSSRSPLVRTTRSSWLWIMTKHSLSTTSSLLLVSNLASILQEKQAWRLMRSVPALLSMPNWKLAQTSSLLVTWYPSMMYSSAVVASNTTTSKSKSYVPVEVVLHTHIQSCCYHYSALYWAVVMLARTWLAPPNHTSISPCSGKYCWALGIKEAVAVYWYSNC